MTDKIFCLIKDDEGDLETYHIQAINEDEAIRKCIEKDLVGYDVLLGIEAYDDCQPDEGESDIEKLVSDSESESEDNTEADVEAHAEAMKKVLAKLTTKDFKKRLELSHRSHFDCPRYTWMGAITVIV